MIVSIIFLLSDIRVLGCLLPRVQDSCFMFSSIILEIDSNKTKSLTCQSLIQIATITISLIVLTVRKAGKTSFYFRHSCAQTETWEKLQLNTPKSTWNCECSEILRKNCNMTSLTTIPKFWQAWSVWHPCLIFLLISFDIIHWLFSKSPNYQGHFEFKLFVPDPSRYIIIWRYWG